MAPRTPLTLLASLVLTVGLALPLRPAVTAQDAATRTGYAVTINRGTCPRPEAAPAYDLGPTAPWNQDAPLDDPRRDAVLAVEQTVRSSLDDLTLSGYPSAVVVHAGSERQGGVAACGDIRGTVAGGKLVVDLRPVGGSTLAGIAILDRDETGILGLGEQETRVSVYLLPGVAAAASAVTLVAGGLANPRGMTWDAQGTLYVAQAGTGETATSVGPAASVVRIDDGCPVAVAGGLPSSFDPYRDVLGPEDVAILDGRLYVLQGATGLFADMNPQTPNGVYAVEADGRLRLVADLTTWIRANEVANVPGDANELGEPYRMRAGDGGLWVLEANRGELLWVTPDGQVSRIADLSAGHPVWTALAIDPDGGVYAGTLTPAPHADGAAKIVKITRDGQVSDVWTGLTTVTGIAVSPDGTLYALEMATGNTPEGGMRPNTGRLVRQTGPDSAEEVVTGLDYPIAMEMGPDGALYVGFPAYGASDLDGAIVRVDLDRSGPTAFDPSLLAGSRCAGAAVAMPAATPVAAEPFPATVPFPSAADLTPVSGQVAVEIRDFKFDPAPLAVTVGTTITWTNRDEVAHTATAEDRSFNSSNLNQNQSFSFTFNEAGTHDYVCIYHPWMTGVIVVT